MPDTEDLSDFRVTRSRLCGGWIGDVWICRHSVADYLDGAGQVRVVEEELSVVRVVRVERHAHQSTLAGYAGLWLMVDEAHITTIGVRPRFRGRGYGELLLVTLTEAALDINARWLTLEVRISNAAAQNLYRKYGFRDAGTRKRYYTDNHEDALIMWTDELHGHAFQERYRRLKERLMARLESAGEVGVQEPP